MLNMPIFVYIFFSYCSWGRVKMHMNLKIRRLGTLELQVMDFYFLFCYCCVVIYFEEAVAFLTELYLCNARFLAL